MEGSHDVGDGFGVAPRVAPRVVSGSTSRISRKKEKIKESDMALARRRATGSRFEHFTTILRQILGTETTREALLKFALEVATIHGLQLDRSAKRLKDCLICWFCENCTEAMLSNMLMRSIEHAQCKTRVGTPFDRLTEDCSIRWGSPSGLFD
jgi:hypothetical protein